MKKFFALFLSFCLLFSFCGCNRKEIPQTLSSSLSSTIFSQMEVSSSTYQNSSQTSSVLNSSSVVQSSSKAPSKESSKTSSAAVTVKPQTTNYENVKAMWLSQFDLNSVYVEKGKQRNKADFESKISTILGNVKKDGFNTIFVQVRPYADSFYPSTVYPASSYVVGDYGGSFTYDPFKIIVEKAHSINLSVHAWINPMRAMKETEIEKIPNIYKIKKWYNDKSKCLVNLDGRLYLNPAYSEVRGLIVDGVSEIIRLYDVDGVHMDDYFYPTTAETFDSEIFAEYKESGGELTLAEFRRDALDKLVSEIYKTVKAKNKDLLFGISPAGNMETVYTEHYADVFRWCANDGFTDYICPQVYFGLEHEFFDFNSVCNKWQSIIKNDKVKLFIGMTLGKAKAKHDAYAGTGKDEWAKHTDILKRCLENTKNLSKCTGVSYFCYQYFYSPLENTPDPDTKAEVGNFIPVLKSIKWK